MRRISIDDAKIIGVIETRPALISLVAGVFMLSGLFLQAHASTTVNIDGNGPGRTFDGIGGVSAGASSELLPDYQEPYRSQILDYLFKPKFGASLQDLKVEIGGGQNSTCGSEPTHALTQAENSNPVLRGYELWMASEARKRNPGITLSCLPWTYPYWTNGAFTQASADWIVSFLNLAKSTYDLNFDYVCADWNEKGTNRDWIVKNLYPSLTKAGYSNPKLISDDIGWQVFDQFATDTAYKNVIYAAGHHYLIAWSDDYINNTMNKPTTAALNSGKPLWATEDYSCSGQPWDGPGHQDGCGALTLARLFNRYYADGRITRTCIWCPIYSFYDALPYAGVGLMKANTPWCGYYEVWPAIWAVAHTTQFADPQTWRYIDGACGQINNNWRGSYVTLREITGNNWSTVICTDVATDMTFSISGGLSINAVHVWKSDKTNQFIQQSDIYPSNGKFTISLSPSSIYTLTTTTGQQKGNYSAIPAKTPFPFPFADYFDSYDVGADPKYFADQEGSFEVTQRSGGGKCLKQIVPAKGSTWNAGAFITPYTTFGDNNWTDYQISADVFIDGGNVEIGGRFDNNYNIGYRFWLGKDGSWKLIYHTTTLANGTISGFNGNNWHNMKVTMQGSTINGYVDSNRVANVSNSSSVRGMAYVGSSYNPNLFDNIIVTTIGGPIPSPTLPGRNVSAFSQTEAPIKESIFRVAGNIITFPKTFAGKTKSVALYDLSGREFRQWDNLKEQTISLVKDKTGIRQVYIVKVTLIP